MPLQINFDICVVSWIYNNYIAPWTSRCWVSLSPCPEGGNKASLLETVLESKTSPCTEVPLDCMFLSPADTLPSLFYRGTPILLSLQSIHFHRCIDWTQGWNLCRTCKKCCHFLQSALLVEEPGRRSPFEKFTSRLPPSIRPAKIQPVLNRRAAWVQGCLHQGVESQVGGASFAWLAQVQGDDGDWQGQVLTWFQVEHFHDAIWLLDFMWDLLYFLESGNLFLSSPSLKYLWHELEVTEIVLTM